MRQKIQEILDAARLAIINWLEKVGKFARTFIKENWQKFKQALKKIEEAKYYRAGIQIITGITSLGAIAYLAYAEPEDWPVFYLLLALLTLLAWAVIPAAEKDYQPERAHIKTRWWVFLGIAFILPLYLMCAHTEFWLVYWRFISLDALGVTILLFFRQAWDETWSDNRWLIMPAALIALWWINSSWIVTYETSQKWEVQAMYPLPLKDDSLRVSFPRQIPFDENRTPAIQIWCDNNIKKNCGGRRVTLYSSDASLLFSYETEPPDWESQLPVRLSTDGTAQAILFVRNPFEPNGKFSLLAQDNGKTKILGDISFETEADAHTRTFWLTLLQGGSVAVTLIGALYAGLKQWDEQKRKDEKDLQKELIGKIRNADATDPQKIVQLMDEIHEKLESINEWRWRPKAEIRRSLAGWITQLNDRASDIAKNWHKYISPRQTENFNLQGEEVLVSLFGKDEQINFIPEFRGAQAEIEQMSPDYSWSSDVVRYPPETYPARHLFVKTISEPRVPEENELKALEFMLLSSNPFGDWDEPFAHGVQDDNKNNFPLLANLRFSFSENRFSNQDYHFLSDWDLRAAFYVFCAEFKVGIDPDVAQKAFFDRAQKTFFVPVMPEDWRDGLSLQSYLLSCLAGRWLEILLHAPHVLDRLPTSEQERLASLLLWRYRSLTIIKHQIEQMLTKEKDPSHPAEYIGTNFWMCLENPSPPKIPMEGNNMLKWLALRPPENYQTLFFCADVSPAGRTQTLQAQSLRSLTPGFATEMQETGIYLVRFLKAQTHEARMRLSFLNPKEWLDSRVKNCSLENTDGGFGRLFPTLNDDDIEKFIAKANGSPGRLVKIANDLLKPYLKGEKNPKEPNFISSDELLARLK